MSFEVTVTPTVYNVEVEVNPSVQPFDVQVITQQDLADLVDEAKQYAEDAEDSADSASASASSASASATTATNQANIATNQALLASAARLNAQNAANAAEDSADASALSASSALASATSAELDAIATAADRVQTGLDRVATGADRVQTGLDRVATGADRVQTGIDANTASTQAGVATTQAGIATTQAGIATTQAGNALTSANNALNSANAAAASASSASQTGTSTLLTGFATGANTTILGTDTILGAFQKAQGQINARVSSNLFTANGTLAGNRTITLGGFTLDVIGATFTNRFSTAGRLLLGNPTESTFLLDVAGEARIVPSANAIPLTISGYSLTGANAQSALSITGTWNTTGTPTALLVNVTDTASSASSLLADFQVGGVSRFRVEKGGGIRSSGALFLGGSTSIAGILAQGTLNQETLLIRSSVFTSTTSVVDIRLSNGQGDPAFISGTRSLVSVDRNFSPTSGNGNYNLLIIPSTINQTGGANGITRGLFVNPTLTSAADWRSIEWSNNTGRGLWGTGTANNALAGATHIGSATNANASAILELTSTTRGLLLPRMTSAERDLIASPVAGLVVYNTTDNKISWYNGTAWANL